MLFRETALPGVLVLEPQRVEDERGFFARTFSEEEFAARGLCTRFAQCSVSYNRLAGTLRGMHFQVPPHEETKLIRCTAGAIFDVALDLRRDSPAYRRWVAVQLTARNRHMIYIPAGVAHGFQALVDDCEVFYQISAPWAPAAARGVRWDDAAFRIEWPAAERRVISERDRGFPDFTE